MCVWHLQDFSTFLETVESQTVQPMHSQASHEKSSLSRCKADDCVDTCFESRMRTVLKSNTSYLKTVHGTDCDIGQISKFHGSVKRGRRRQLRDRFEKRRDASDTPSDGATCRISGNGGSVHSNHSSCSDTTSIIQSCSSRSSSRNSCSSKLSRRRSETSSHTRGRQIMRTNLTKHRHRNGSSSSVQRNRSDIAAVRQSCNGNSGIRNKRKLCGSKHVLKGRQTSRTRSIKYKCPSDTYACHSQSRSSCISSDGVETSSTNGGSRNRHRRSSNDVGSTNRLPWKRIKHFRKRFHSSDSDRLNDQPMSCKRTKMTKKDRKRLLRKGCKHDSMQKRRRGRGDHGEKTGITVGMSKTSGGKRVRDKKLVCFVCKSKVLWLSRHLEKCHHDNFLVAQVMAKSGHARQCGLKRLRNLGSFKHNIDVLKQGEGELMVVRRTSGKHSHDMYLPCTRCYGFFYQYDLWRHRCPCRHEETDEPEESNSRSADSIDGSRSLLEGALQSENSKREVDKQLNKHILSRMRRDANLRVVKTDALILQFGVAQLKRIGVKGRRRIAARMRLLAKLVVQLRNALDLHNKSLEHFLNGMYFDGVIEAIEDMCGLHSDEHGQRSFDRPSVALSIGNILTKTCHIKRGIAIRNGDDGSLKEVDSFVALLKTEYSDSVSCPALATLKSKTYNKPVELPTTDDLTKLKKFTEEKMHNLVKQLKTAPYYGTWRQLSEVVLTRLVVFNKRRANEPAKLLLSQYNNRPDWKQESNRELVENLQPLERKLMDRMDLIQVPGKRNRRVPILITPEVGKAMKELAATRTQCGISAKNPYFFATDSVDGYQNTWLVLHNNAVAAGVKKPRLITSCRLRKYVATLSQVCITVNYQKYIVKLLLLSLNGHSSR